MDTLLLLKAALMGVVEGLTEFLPVSSTGHLILVGSLLGLDDAKAGVFDIAIQSGAIFALVWIYRQKITALLPFWRSANNTPSVQSARRLWLNVGIAFIPAAVLGLLFGKAIKTHLFTPQVVAGAFIVGGGLMLWLERWYAAKTSAASKASQLVQVDQEDFPSALLTLDTLRPQHALWIGLCQCLALIPGTSRSAASIWGGMWGGLSRLAAVEFSFLLAMPTLIGAGLYSVYKDRALLSLADWPFFAVGFLTAFFSAWVTVRWLLRYVSNHSFVPFAWYRIGFGGLILLSPYLHSKFWS